jgi:hypothetical protein
MSELPEFPAPEAVQVLRLEPGDVLVLRYEHKMRPETIDTISQRLKAFFADNRVMVLDGGASIEVVRPEVS